MGLQRPKLRDNERRLMLALAALDDGGLIRTRSVQRRLGVHRGWFSPNARRLRAWGWVEHIRNGYARLTDPGWAVIPLIRDNEGTH